MVERDTIVVADETLREGFTQVPNRLLRAPGLTHGAKLCYALLLSYAWQADRCFPGQERLARDLGVERKAVIRYLAELKEKGLVLVQRRGLGKTNVYVLPKLADVPFLGLPDVPSPGRPDVPGNGREEDPEDKNIETRHSLRSFERHTPSGESV
jgi:hypothetical protein